MGDPCGTLAGSWSCVGTDIMKVEPSSPTMNLSWVSDTEDTDDTEQGVILHEFGHTIGLGHEHQSPKFGGTITLKPEGM